MIGACALARRLLRSNQRFCAQVQQRYGRPLRVESLRDVPVAPLEELLRRWAGGSVLRGGPQAASLPALLHFRGDLQACDPASSLDALKGWPVHHGRLFWCGPLCDHFGHQVGEFASRILLSSLDPRPGALLFLQAEPAPLQSWQRALIHYLNPCGKPVMVSAGGFTARRLVAIPQQQRLAQDPTLAYLIALSLRSWSLRGHSEAGITVLSRARHAPARSPQGMRGSFAGEVAFDALMARLGARIVYPEELSLEQQLRLFRNARRLVVSEGSALHALELMGYQPKTQLVVIARRPHWPGQERPLQCRFPKLHWLDAVEQLYSREGTNPRVKGLARIDWFQLLPGLGEVLGWTFSVDDAAALNQAAEQQIQNLEAQIKLRMHVCTSADRQAADSGFW